MSEQLAQLEKQGGGGGAFDKFVPVGKAFVNINSVVQSFPMQIAGWFISLLGNLGNGNQYSTLTVTNHHSFCSIILVKNDGSFIYQDLSGSTFSIDVSGYSMFLYTGTNGSTSSSVTTSFTLS